MWFEIWKMGGVLKCFVWLNIGEVAISTQNDFDFEVLHSASIPFNWIQYTMRNPHWFNAMLLMFRMPCSSSPKYVAISRRMVDSWLEVSDLHSAWFLSIEFNVWCEAHNALIQCLNWCSKDHVGYEERWAVWFYKRGKNNSCVLGCDSGLFVMFTMPWSSSPNLLSPNI